MSEMTGKGAGQELWKRNEARRDLLNFTEFTHPSWESGEHHRLICDWLMKIEKGVINRLCINAPPRHSKSELASRRFPAWYLGKHPTRQVIAASATGLFAQDIGADVRDIVRSPEYTKLFPQTAVSDKAAAAGRWRTSEGGIYYACGVDGMVVGRGAHIAVIDDPHGGRAKAESPRERQIVREWFYGDLLTRLMTPEAILLMMTRWHEEDLAGALLPPESEWEPVSECGRVFRADDWFVIVLKAIQFEDTEYETALWPGSGKGFGYPLERLQGLRKTMSRAGRSREWNAQYQQNPMPEEGIYCKKDWYEARWSDKPDNMSIYMSFDPAVTAAADGPDPDYTEIGIFGLDEHDKLHVLDWWYGRVTADVWIAELLDMADKWKPATIFGEAGIIRRATEPIIERTMRDRRSYHQFSYLPHGGKDKAARGRAFQAWSRTNRVIFPKKAHWVDRVIAQVCGFPALKHDDAFDVCSNMCLAIDETHASVVEVKPIPKKRIYYQDKAQDDGYGWKVM